MQLVCKENEVYRLLPLCNVSPGKASLLVFIKFTECSFIFYTFMSVTKSFINELFKPFYSYETDWWRLSKNPKTQGTSDLKAVFCNTRNYTKKFLRANGSGRLCTVRSRSRSARVRFITAVRIVPLASDDKRGGLRSKAKTKSAIDGERNKRWN